MGYAEKRENYWRGRYKIEPGRYGTVVDASGLTVRFRTRREAEKAANESEARARGGATRNRAAGQVTFGEYVSRWYAAQDLAASTMQNYRRHIEEHLLPTFEDVPIAAITDAAVVAWERREVVAGYAPSSIKTWRGTLHLVLGEAVEEGLRESNPAARRRGRGRRDRRSRGRGPEKVVTTALGVVLIAERAALSSGRDDEFVGIVLKGFTGMRWGELVGLEPEYVRKSGIRIEWQLYPTEATQALASVSRALGTIIATVVWVFLSSVAVLFGGEINAAIDRRRHQRASRRSGLDPPIVSPSPSTLDGRTQPEGNGGQAR